MPPLLAAMFRDMTMQSIIKYCSDEHHFENTKKLQIGTLKYYREHEKVEIADRQEGLTPGYEVINSSKDLEYDAQTLEVISGGGVSGGGIMISKGATVRLNTRVQIPNQYIFCATNEDIGCKKTAKSLGYDAWYKINNIEHFMREATISMAGKIRFSNALLYSCQIQRLCGPIEYGHGLKTLDGSAINPYLDAAFQKPVLSDLDRGVNFENNNEYRLLWLTFDEATGLIHDVHKEPILIDFTDEMKSVCSS